MAYDYLIVATGSTHSYFGHEEWSKIAPGLKTIEDATDIRRRVLLAFEYAERQMLETGAHPPLRFVVVGGGPTGVELAGAISDISRLYMTRDFRHIDTKTAEVVILEGGAAGARDVSGRPAEEGARAAACARRKGSLRRTGHRHSARLRDGRATSGSRACARYGRRACSLRRWGRCSAWSSTRRGACW